jgi:subtilisin family serine protease
MTSAAGTFAQTDNDPRDLDGHGTHVAGTIGARGNNGLGVTGVNLNVSLMAVRVLGADGSGTAAGVANGFDYAGDMGVKVVNASLGGGGHSKTIEDAIDRHPKTLYVVAAGNNGANNDGAPMYPCTHTAANLICVAATNETDELTDWSNYGAKSVDLAAPGTEIVSSWPGYETVFSDGFRNGRDLDRRREALQLGTHAGVIRVGKLERHRFPRSEL